MPKIEIATHGAQGTITVDGKPLPGVIGYRVEHGLHNVPVIMVELRATSQHMEIADGVLKIDGIVAPKDLERALFAYLWEKHGPTVTEVTTLDDEAQRFARVAPLTRWEPGTVRPDHADPASA